MGEIVYIPGFMGTELLVQGAGGPHWTLGDGLLGKSQILDMVRYPAEQVSIGGPLRHVYSGHVESLTAAGHSVHFFGYDWRYGLAHHLPALEQFVDAQLQGRPFAFVCHSTGGLLAARFLASRLPGGKITFIGFGVPVAGVDYAAIMLFKGDDRLLSLMPFADTQLLLERLRRLPSLYELLPHDILEARCREFWKCGHLHKDLLEHARDEAGIIRLDFAALRKAEKAHFITDSGTSMRVVGVADGEYRESEGYGDGWIAAERSYPSWAEPEAVSPGAADFIRGGPLGLAGFWLSPHPVQAIYKAIRESILTLLETA